MITKVKEKLDSKIEEKKMKLKSSRIMIILFIIAITAGAMYFVLQNSSKEEERNNPITYETINMVTNLRLGISEFDSIHPYLTKNREVIYISSLIFEPLLTITQDYRITNCLTQEWSKVGEKGYILKLKENVSWSDKSSLTAEDVKFSIEQLKQRKESIYYENVKNIQTVEIVDKNTIRIELKQIIPFFEYQLIFPILSKKQYEKEDLLTSKQIPIGTGKYKITSIDKEKIELSQNENWRDWETQIANTKTVTIYLYETMGEVYNDFKLGNIDMLHTTKPNVEEYIGSMGYGKKDYAGREYDYMAFECENSILQHQEVRKAIVTVLNKQNIVATALENKAMMAQFPLEKEHYLIKEIESMKSLANETTQKAKKILQEEGWKYEYGIWQKQIEGRTTTIHLTLSVRKSDEQRKKVAQEIKKQLEAVGIKIEIEEISDNKYQNILKNHQYEMLLTGIYTPLSPDLTFFFGKENLTNYQNQEINTILKELNSITEEELRKEKYQRIIEIYQEEVPFISLYCNREMVAYSANFRGDVVPNNYQIYEGISNWYRQE